MLALEHLVMLELDRDHGTSAGELVTTLATDPGKHAERDRHLKDLTLMDVTTCSARCRSRVTAAMGARLPRSRS